MLGYIKDALAAGRAKGDLYKELLNQGWQLDVVEQHYKAATFADNKGETQKKTIKIILAIAILLIAAGIFSFIASNWQDIGKAAKLLIILVFMLGSYAAGWYTAEVKKYPKSGKALILLGAIVYGAGIFLVAQMFNIRANWPDGFILWMMGVLLLAYLMDEFAYYYLAIVLGLVAIFGYPTDLFGFSSSSNIFLFTSTVFLVLTTLVTLFIGLVMWKRAQAKLNNMQ